jgi:hypothetical protein
MAWECSAITSGRLRKPAILWLAFAFALSALLTAFWSVSCGHAKGVYLCAARGHRLDSLGVCQTKEDQQQLLLAYCLGMFVPVFFLLDNCRWRAD